jgi:cytoskeletal protein RodZ
MHSNPSRDVNTKKPLAWAMKTVVVIVVLISVFAGVRWAYVHWAPAEIQERTLTSMQPIRKQIQEQLLTIKAKSQLLLEQAASVGIFRFDNKQREEDLREAEVRRQQKLMAAKEAAWEKFYEPRPECTNPSLDTQFVECGNEYRRAKVRFEEMWQSKMP